MSSARQSSKNEAVTMSRQTATATLEVPRRPRVKSPRTGTKTNGAVAHTTMIAERELMDLRGQIQAINKAQAVIEFDLDGMVLTANENFLAVMGYRLDEVQ